MPVDRAVRAPLLRWYRRAKRDLPWRRVTDPYAIWVSEVMLQQTTVAAVVPYWQRFLERYPGIAALARSREEDVLALWSGLGYYTRARALRRGAIAVAERHGGRVPDDLAALIALPGIGRYTAGAIASLAYGREAPVVDGNVKRVFSRLFAIRGAGAKIERRYWAIAESLVPGPRPGDWNQALMELGATICTPRAPRCDACPVASSCRALALGRPESFPSRVKRAPQTVLPVAAAWIEKRARVLLVRRPAGGPLRGTWDLPAAVIAPRQTASAAIAANLAAEHGVRFSPGPELLRASHSILSKRLAISVVSGTCPAGFARRPHVRWVPLSGLDRVAISGATAKIARGITGQRRSHESRETGSSGGSGRANA